MLRRLFARAIFHLGLPRAFEVRLDVVTFTGHRLHSGLLRLKLGADLRRRL